MLESWMRLVLDTTLLGLEAQSVVVAARGL
jgi:hypothetical protein